VRKVVDPRLKVAVAQAALKEDHSTGQIARKFHVSSHQVESWKKEALDMLQAGFSEIHATKPFNPQRLVDELYCKWSQRDIVAWLTRTQHSFAGEAAAGSIILIRSRKTTAPRKVLVKSK
jgi:transposase-like protein